jgi:hypothetical protein
MGWTVVHGDILAACRAGAYYPGVAGTLDPYDRASTFGR